MTIARQLQEGVEQAILNYGSNQIEEWLAALRPIALSGLVIYFVLMGVAIAYGSIQESLSNVAWRFVKIALILFLALYGANVYQNNIIDLATQIEQLMMEVLRGTATAPQPQSIGTMVDEQVAYIEVLARTLYEHATRPDIPDIPLLSAALLSTFCQIVVVAGTLIPLLVAKVTLQILFSVGPVFILLAIWPATQRYTEAWLGATLSALFSVVLVTVVIGFLPLYTGEYVRGVFWTTPPPYNTAIPNPTRLNDALTKVGELVIVVLACLAIIWRIAAFARSLFSGAAWHRAAHHIVSSVSFFNHANTRINAPHSSYVTQTHIAERTLNASLAQQHVLTQLQHRR